MNGNYAVKVNDVEIQIVYRGEEKWIPIRPICDALGIDVEGQRKKIEIDDFLKSVAESKSATGADGKTYEMLCLPYQFIFGWLFTINPKNVKPEAQEAVLKYRTECYEALFKYFTEPELFLREKQKHIELALAKYDSYRDNFKNAKLMMDDARKELDEVRKFSIDEWRENNRQLRLNFE